jgi:lipid-A-disaccharide synthase
MLVVFPFEEGIYREAGIPVSYVGHPLADILGEHPGRAAARLQLRLPAAAPVVALLPGSRVSELEHMAEVFLGAARIIAEARPDVSFLLPVVNRETRQRAEDALRRVGGKGLPVTLLSGHAHDAMAAADVVLVASGTATLEAALLRRPMVVAYRMPWISWWIMRRQAKVEYVGLPNILAGERIVPELLQDAATPAKLAQAVLDLMNDPIARARMESRFAALHDQLRQGTDEKVAAALAPFIVGTAA